MGEFADYTGDDNDDYGVDNTTMVVKKIRNGDWPNWTYTLDDNNFARGLSINSNGSIIAVNIARKSNEFPSEHPLYTGELGNNGGHLNGSVLLYTKNGDQWIRDAVIHHDGGNLTSSNGYTFGDIVKINKDACISNRAAPITLTILTPNKKTHVYTHGLSNETTATCAPTASPA